MADPQILSSAVVPIAITDTESRNTLTFGDFLWEGSSGATAFVKVNASSGNGKAYFFKKQAGAWVVAKTFDLDVLLPAGTACAVASRALTVDLNNDKRHDVFVTCKGAGISTAHQLLFLSGATPDAYQVAVLKDETGAPLLYRGYQASVADLDGNGAMDIVLTDRTDTVKFLMGVASSSATDRRYTLTAGRLIYASTSPVITLPGSEIHGIELIPNSTANRRFDLILMSSTTNGRPTWLVKGVVENAVTRDTYFYASQAEFFPFTNASSPGEVVDVLHDAAGYYYLNMQNPARTAMQIMKVPDDLSASASVLSTNSFADGTSAQLMFTSDGKVTVQDGDCAENVSLSADSRCSVNATK